MKKIILLSLTVIAVLLIAGCGNTPKTAAKEFLTTMEQHNYTGAVKYVAKDSQQALQYIKQGFDSMTTIEKQDNPKRKYKIIETEIVVKNESAIVTYEESILKPDGTISDEKPYTGKLKLITEDDKWKVVLEPGMGF